MARFSNSHELRICTITQQLHSLPRIYLVTDLFSQEQQSITLSIKELYENTPLSCWTESKHMFAQKISSQQQQHFSVSNKDANTPIDMKLWYNSPVIQREMKRHLQQALPNKKQQQEQEQQLQQYLNQSLLEPYVCRY